MTDLIASNTTLEIRAVNIILKAMNAKKKIFNKLCCLEILNFETRLQQFKNKKKTYIFPTRLIYNLLFIIFFPTWCEFCFLFRSHRQAPLGVTYKRRYRHAASFMNFFNTSKCHYNHRVQNLDIATSLTSNNNLVLGSDETHVALENQSINVLC